MIYDIPSNEIFFCSLTFDKNYFCFNVGYSFPLNAMTNS